MSKEERQKQYDTLQRALVEFKKKVLSDENWENKSDYERNLEHLLNALLMELHIGIDQQQENGNKNQAKPQSPVEQMLSQMLATYSSVKSGDVPIANQVANDFSDALKMLDLAHNAKQQGKTMLANDKLKGLGD